MSDFEEDLSAYIDQELSPERALEVEAALTTDPALRSLERRLRRSIDAIEALPLPETSPALRRAVLAAIDAPSFWERWFTLPRLLPLGLAVAAGVSAMVFWPRAAEESSLDEENEENEEKLLLAQNLEVVEDLDLFELGSPEDLDVVTQLHELEVPQ